MCFAINSPTSSGTSFSSISTIVHHLRKSALPASGSPRLPATRSYSRMCSHLPSVASLWCQEKPVKAARENRCIYGKDYSSRAASEVLKVTGTAMKRLAVAFPKVTDKLVKGLLHCQQVAVGAADRKLAERLETLAKRL